MRLTQLFLRLTQLIIDCGQLFSFLHKEKYSVHWGYKRFLNVKILFRSHRVSSNKIMFRIIKFEKFQKIKKCFKKIKVSKNSKFQSRLK